MLPDAFIKRMQLQMGIEFEAFDKSIHEPTPISIRYNRFKFSGEIQRDAIPWESNGIYLDERPSFTLDPLFHAGVYYVQEASSMFTGWIAKQLLANFEFAKVLDLCAAPGGKSTHLASVINDKSLLVSNEVIGTRASILAENLIKWGNPNVFVSRNDPKDFTNLNDYFDIVVVDAPCSGEGLFRRDASAISEWSVDNTRLCAQRQQRIINDVWPALKPDGYLIYSTCTFNPAENDENMKWLLEQYDAEPVFFEVPASWNIKTITSGIFKGYQFFPHKVKGEGFFLGIIQKTGGSRSSKTKVKQKDKNQPVSKAVLEQVKNYLINPEEFLFIQKQETIQAIPTAFETDYNFLQTHLYFIEAGIGLAKVFGNKVQPEHNLALSWQLNTTSFSTVELSLNEALQYLHRDNIFIKGAETGINLVTYKQYPLGWIKNIGNRWNNLYPANWRIRMDLPKAF
jgi:16S rRNA C967 or C1407 C5-methylase (RsmB/RsmF family)/NOL1/NOP2/fmu family ribosome biogenesis protein